MENELKIKEEYYNSRIFNFIRDIVCIYYKENNDIFDRKTRKREIIKCKHHTLYLCLQNTNSGPTEIGAHFRVDHATVIHARNKILGYLDFDTDLKNEFAEIQQLILQKGRGVIDNFDIKETHYYIDLNECCSIKMPNQKSIILSGYSEEEAQEFIKKSEEHRWHKKTGLYILEDKNDKKNEHEHAK